MEVKIVEDHTTLSREIRVSVSTQEMLKIRGDLIGVLEKTLQQEFEKLAKHCVADIISKLTKSTESEYAVMSSVSNPTTKRPIRTFTHLCSTVKIPDIILQPGLVFQVACEGRDLGLTLPEVLRLTLSDLNPRLTRKLSQAQMFELVRESFEAKARREIRTFADSGTVVHNIEPFRALAEHIAETIAGQPAQVKKDADGNFILQKQIDACGPEICGKWCQKCKQGFMVPTRVHYQKEVSHETYACSICGNTQ